MLCTHWLSSLTFGPPIWSNVCHLAYCRKASCATPAQVAYLACPPDVRNSKRFECAKHLSQGIVTFQIDQFTTSNSFEKWKVLQIRLRLPITIMSKISKIFGGSSSSSSSKSRSKHRSRGESTPGEAIQKLRETEAMLTKKQEYLERKIDEEIAIARKNGTRNKRGKRMANPCTCHSL